MAAELELEVERFELEADDRPEPSEALRQTRERGALAWREIGFATFGRLVGGVAAAGLLASVNLDLFYILFGLMVLIGVALSVVINGNL